MFALPAIRSEMFILQTTAFEISLIDAHILQESELHSVVLRLPKSDKELLIPDMCRIDT